MGLSNDEKMQLGRVSKALLSAEVRQGECSGKRDAVLTTTISSMQLGRGSNAKTAHVVFKMN